MLRKKPYIEQHKTTAEKHLALQAEMLKSKGMTEKQIQRDSRVRHLKGKIRQAAHQLSGIAELEEMIARKAEIKIEKQAHQKERQPKKRHTADPATKKAKKDKKMAAARAEA